MTSVVLCQSFFEKNLAGWAVLKNKIIFILNSKKNDKSYSFDD